MTTLWGYCSPHITNFLNLKRNVNSLRSTIRQLECKRDDVMHKIRLAESDLAKPMSCTNEVKCWLERVEAIKKQVNEILEQTIFTQTLILSNSVIEKLTTVRELIKEGEFKVVAERCLQEPIQEIPTAAGVVGMEPKLEELLKFVNEDDQVKSLRILGIYGMGGVGKTTLLRNLNNELSKRKDGFHLAIWVVVSKDMNLQNVRKKIADSLNLSLSDKSDLETTANEIFTALKKKKFVLFLDDIWQRIDLRSIGVSSRDSTNEINKSMVVFTTRSVDVCGQMEAHRKIKVDCLNESEAWSLFQEKVGSEVINGHRQIPELAKVVAKECCGLPLALNTIGRTMASKKEVRDWRRAIKVLQKSASEFEGMDDQVLQILKFSYDNLRNDKTKSCFLYCSLFPNDYDGLKREKLIDYWIAEEFIDDFENIDDARDQGRDIIGNLMNVSLLETYSSSDLESVKMHDIVRDLAIWIVSDYGRNKGKYLTDVGLEPKPDEWEKAEKISVMNDSRHIINPSTNCSNLTTLIILHEYTLNFAWSSLACDNMPKLRVLSIDRYSTFSANIFQLSELRYLDLCLTSLNFLPNQLKSLSKLRFLRLATLSTKLPSGVIPCLAQLRVLDMHGSDTNFKDWEMEGCASLMELESLEHLNDLGIIIGNLVALQKLVSSSKFQLITRRLSITNCEGIASVSLSKSSPSLSLSNLKNLQKLDLYDCSELKELRISPWGMETLESLILTWLPELEIVWDLPADPLQEEQLFLWNLQSVEISGCESIKNLTWLTYAHDLKILDLMGMDELEEIISDGFLVDDHTKLNMFSNLTRLQLSDLPNLRSICSNSLAFPDLEWIGITSCPKLKKLPLHNNSNKNNTSLVIYGENEWWDSLEWDDDTPKAHFHFVTKVSGG